MLILRITGYKTVTRNVQLNGTGSDSSTTIIERGSEDSGNGTTPLYQGNKRMDIVKRQCKPFEQNHHWKNNNYVCIVIHNSFWTQLNIVLQVSAARLSPYNLTLLLLPNGQPKETWLTWINASCKLTWTNMSCTSTVGLQLDGATQNQRPLLVQRDTSFGCSKKRPRDWQSIWSLTISWENTVPKKTQCRFRYCK